MDTPRAPRFTFIDAVNFLGAVMISLWMSGFATYALWYNTMSDPLLKGCCELSDNQYRMLHGKYLNNMTLLKLNRTWFLERLPDCVIVINSTQQLAPQRCCNERHLLSLTMPSDAFKIYERPLNCGHVACKNISNRFKMGFYTFLLFCVAHWLAYSNVKAAYTYPRRVAEIRRVQARMAARERREVAQTQTMPAAGQ
ncbi:uncharacterized protein LOC142804151 [Rhipicephalus microplus]|uniref:uncharacterized protein LOC142804151 n=1 Tax=Rhipicephalus microplus TaxID=6941 RepID=UPI003F6BB21A